MKRTFVLTVSILLLLLLAACGGTETTGDGVEGSSDSQGSDSGSVGDSGAVPEEKVRLTEDYSGALPVQTQLAVGIMQLEETELAVDEALAAEMLPLWRAVQSLSNSDTTAPAEINAVLNQIQDTMAPEQIRAIADMKLTDESLTELIEEGGLAFGPGGLGGSARGVVAASGGFPGGGFGGGPPGGFAGGGPGGGGFAGGGPPGGFGNLSEDDIATRQAQFEAGDFSAFQGRALMGAVLRLLEVKTGEAPAAGEGGIFGSVFEIVSEETGLSAEEIQELMSEGATLAEIIADNGGDLESVEAALREAFSSLPRFEDQDIEEQISDFLNNPLFSGAGE